MPQILKKRIKFKIAATIIKTAKITSILIPPNKKYRYEFYLNKLSYRFFCLSSIQKLAGEILEHPQLEALPVLL